MEKYIVSENYMQRVCDKYNVYVRKKDMLTKFYVKKQLRQEQTKLD